MSRLSLRSRVLIGAGLWTFGLLATTCVVGVMMLLGHPIQHAIVLRSFISRPATWLIVAVASMFVGMWQVRKGLSALDQLRGQLSKVRDGHHRQITGSYPSEVQPLVSDLNLLLEHREIAIRRAIGKAGDLAHGLKTPLAVLAQEAARVRAEGRAELADSIDRQVDRMRRQVEYHLAQARAAASGATPGARASVGDSAASLARTLRQLYAERGIVVEVTVGSSEMFRGQREDLDEMLGNLLDNACKWARSRVAVTSDGRDDGVTITIDDDGPGLEPSMREAVLHRGVRADEAAPGSGLGLAIVRDLAELYGGAIALGDSPLGGLRATLRLPQHQN